MLAQHFHLNNMKKIILAIFISILTFSCNTKTENPLEEFFDDFSFKKIIADSDKIIIRLYDSKETEKRSGMLDSFPPKKTFKIIGSDQIESFREIFHEAQQTYYCCCPTANYSISFLENEEVLDVFYVDTIQFKDKVRIYEGSYQYSYIIEMQKWKNFLIEVENK